MQPLRISLVLTSLIALLALGATLAPAPTATAAPIGDDGGEMFTVDTMHSTLIFRLRHFGVSNFWGRVNQPRGTFHIDDANLAGSTVHIMVDVKHMDAGNDGRDRFLLSPDFFNAREYPTAEFKSTSIKKLSDGRYEANGEFTLRGITRPLVAIVDDYTTLQTKRFGFRAGFECTFTVKRSDFGMNMFVEEGTLGDDVTITAAIEGVVQPS